MTIKKLLAILFASLLLVCTLQGPAMPAPTQPTANCAEETCVFVVPVVGQMTEHSNAGVIAYIAAANRLGAKRIILAINSPGGDGISTARLFDAVRDSAAPVHCYAKDLVASAAFWLLQACDERILEENTRAMTHWPKVRFTGQGWFNRHDLENSLAILTAVHVTMVAQISARLGITPTTLDVVLSRGDWVMTPEQAVDVKAADGVYPAGGFATYIKDVSERAAR